MQDQSVPPVVTPPTAPAAPSNGFAVTSLVTGILAAVTGVFSIGTLFILSIPLGIIGLVFGILGLRHNQSKGMSIAGIVTSSAGLFAGLAFLTWVILAIAIGTAAGFPSY